MTSTEFSAKYRLLKNVASRGARSFLAQQVELGRMVMVHYLDSETPEQRASTLAQLNALRPPARSKLLEIAEVDGAPVAVTLFITSFVDFATWLESVRTPAPLTQTPEPVEAPAKSVGGFTGIFGKVESPAPSTPPAAPSITSPASSRDEEVDTPTIIMAPIKAKRVAAKPIAPPPAARPPVAAAPSAPPPSDSSFTAIFGRLGDTPFLNSDLSVEVPASEPKAVLPPVAPPAASGFDGFPMFSQPTAATPSPSSAPGSAQPGEFTQLFQRMAPGGGAGPATPVPSFMPPTVNPSGAADLPRPIDLAPKADVPLANLSSRPAFPGSSFGDAPPLPSAPSFGAPLRADPPAILPPTPNFGNGAPHDTADAPPASPIPVWGAAPPAPNLGSSFDAPGQSEYTRILGRVAVPLPPPPVAVQPPAAAPAKSEQKGSKSLAPLWIGLAVVVLLTIAMVVYFGMRGA